MQKSSSNRPLKIPGRRTAITKRMIESAIENTKSNAEASRWLGIAYNTYKKYSKIYGLYDNFLDKIGIFLMDWMDGLD